MKKKGAVKGETTKMSYKPGERLAESKPPDEGIYEFTLSKMGKPFPKGWKAKPKKFPNRMTLWKALDTEDEISGKEKELADFISLSPGAIRRGAMRIAQAAQYPLELEVVKDASATNHPSVKRNAAAIDKMLTHIKNEELTLRGEVSHEEWNGEKRARIKWLPPEDLDDSEDEDGDESEVEEETDDGAFGGDEDEDEAPKKGKKGKKAKEEDEDEDDDDSDAEDDDSDGDDSDEDDEDGEDDDDGDDDDSSDDDDSEDEDSDDEEDEESDEDDEVGDVEELKKKAKPGKKVKQGPAKGGKKKAETPPKKKGKK